MQTDDFNGVNDSDETVTLATVMRKAIRRYLPLVLLLTLIGALGGFGAAKVLGQTYTATSSVIVRPAPGNSLSPTIATASGNQLNVAMTTEVALVTTPQVAAKASKMAGHTLPGPNDSVTATVPPSTQIVQISYTAPSAKAAMAGADAYANAYLAFRGDNAKNSTDTQVKALVSQLNEATALLKTASAQASNITDPRAYAAQQQQLYAERIATLNNAISTAQSASEDAGSVIQASTLPTSPDGVPAVVFLLAGAILGALVGLLLAFARQLQDNRIHGKSTTAVQGLPVLAATTTPMQILRTGHGEDSSIGALQETFRQLRTAVTTSAGRGSIIAMSSLAPVKPTAVLAYNLAASLTAAGYRACVLDLDTPNPALFSQLGASAPSARGTAIASQMVEGTEIQCPGEGIGPDDFAGPTFHDQLEAVRSSHDYTIIAVAPSGTAAGDAGVALADATIFVATENKSTDPDVREARRRNLRLGAPAVGLFCVGEVPTNRPNQPPARLTAGEPADSQHVVHD